MVRGACRGCEEASLNTLHNTNAEKDESLIREAEAIANGSALEANSVESESLLSGSFEASNAGLAIAPVTPALALAQ